MVLRIGWMVERNQLWICIGLPSIQSRIFQQPNTPPSYSPVEGGLTAKGELVRGKGAALHEDLVAGGGGLVESGHQQVEVHRETVCGVGGVARPLLVVGVMGMWGVLRSGWRRENDKRCMHISNRSVPIHTEKRQTDRLIKTTAISYAHLFMIATSTGLAPTIAAMSSRQSSSAVTQGLSALTPGKWPYGGIREYKSE